MSMVARMASVLQSVFSECAQEANQEAGAVQRVRKFDAPTLMQTFVLGLLHQPRANAEDLAATAAAVGVEVSPQAVEQRYSPQLCEFFRLLLFRMAAKTFRSEESLAPLLERFTEVKLLDSTSLQLPDGLQEEYPSCGGRGQGGQAVMKLHLELDLRSGQLAHLETAPGKEPDQGCARQQAEPAPGSLRIADLGYFSLAALAKIAAGKAYFLSRFQRSVSAYVDGVKQDLVRWLSDQEQRMVDRRIELGPQRFPCRLIAWRVPEEVANRRRAKLRQHTRDKTGREPTQAALEACDWGLLLTNLQEEQLSVKEAIVLYRGRWQIELLFKRWKSMGCVAQLEGRNDVVVMTRVWARLCAAVVQHWLTVLGGWSSQRLVSFAKLARLIQELARDLALALHDRVLLEQALQRLVGQAARRARRTKRKKKPGALELLRNPEHLEFTLT
jgi:hypothetical protein